MPSLVRPLCCTLVLLLAPALARAQYTNRYGYTFNNPISASCNALFWDKMNARLIYRMMLKKRGYTDEQLGQMSTEQMRAVLGGPSKPPPEAKRSQPGAATKFKPAGKRLLLPALASGLVQDPEQRKALLQVFEAGIKGYEKEARASGFASDVAGAMAFFIGVSYFVYRGEEPNSTGLEHLAVALQRTLDTAAFRAIADSDKQKFYELMIGLGTFLGASHQQARASGDAELAEKLKQAAAEVLKGFLKLDPDKVRFTEAGLDVAS